jgi:glycosyltransferase involved in cell wall biosynthesis
MEVEPSSPSAEQLDRPLATLLVVTYNQEATIRAALEGAFAQTYQPLEISVADDGSSDRTPSIIAEMAASYKGPHHVVVHRNANNLGMMGNIDQAMTAVSGEFVIANHGDDVSLPHRVERIMSHWLATDRRAMAIHTARRRMDEHGALHEVIDDARVLANMTPLEVIRDHGTLVGASMGWARKLWEVFGPVAPIGKFDDFPTAFRASLIGEIHYLPEPLLHYRQGGISAQPMEELGHHYLYGFRIKNYQWHRTFWCRYLADMETVRPENAEECRRLCLEKIGRADFHIAMAATPRWKLPLRVPGALLSAVRHRDLEYAKEPLRYLLAPLYKRRFERKMAKAAA